MRALKKINSFSSHFFDVGKKGKNKKVKRFYQK